MSDKLEVLQYSTAGVDVAVIYTVKILFNEWQHSGKLTGLQSHQCKQ